MNGMSAIPWEAAIIIGAGKSSFRFPEIRLSANSDGDGQNRQDERIAGDMGEEYGMNQRLRRGFNPWLLFLESGYGRIAENGFKETPWNMEAIYDNIRWFCC